MARLSLTDAEQRIKGLNGWTLQGDAIRKQFTFRDFLEAIAFVNCLAPKAEAADHHPDILINYKRVTLTYSTHSEGGLTDEGLRRAPPWPINAPEAHLQFARGRGADRADRAAAAAVGRGRPARRRQSRRTRPSAGGYTERRYTPIELFELLVLADLRRRGFTVHQLHQHPAGAWRASSGRVCSRPPAAAARSSC